MQFEFATAGRIVFGAGSLQEAGAAVATFGTRVLVVTGGTVERAQRLIEGLSGAGMDLRVFSVEGEPTTDTVRQALEVAREQDAQVVVGFGGGSAIDTGKATAAMRTNPGDIADYIVGAGGTATIENRPAPFVAIPTTAGTGAEATKNAVIGIPERKVKASLRSPLMLPALAIVDPELTLDLPPELTASTGLDALTQLIEAYVSTKANPVVSALCEDGFRLVARSLARAFHNPGELCARKDMALASLYGGIALANAGLGAVHGFAAPIGGMFEAAHGAVCAALLPFTMEGNVQALRSRAPHSVALERYRAIARILTGRERASVHDGVVWVKRLCETVGVAPLRTFGVDDEHAAEIAERAEESSSMKSNPVELTRDEMVEILRSGM